MSQQHRAAAKQRRETRRCRKARPNDQEDRMMASEASVPPLRLVIRSKTHGVEVLGAPEWRACEAGEGELSTESTSSVGTQQRTMLAVSPCGGLYAMNGGGAPIEVASAWETTTTTNSIVFPSETSAIERFEFSPRGTYLVTWQKSDASKLPDGSLRVWSTSGEGAGTVKKSFHCKQLKRNGIGSTLAWSGDEAVCFHCVTNTIHVYRGALEGGGEQLKAIHADDVALISAASASTSSESAGPPYPVAAFVPERKGRPANVKIFATPGKDDAHVCFKSFFRAQDVTIQWSPGGHACLVRTHTDVDATGGSYYGGTGLYLMSATSDFECLVPLPKEGPVADAQWEPSKGREFVVVAGAVPACAAVYDLQARQLYSFGAGHRNTVAWSPHGRFLALCGFGNLAGDVDFWDRHKKKKLNTINVPCCVDFGWSSDSRFFMAATLAPRMNVDNCVRLYRYDGTGPVVLKTDRVPLFECRWAPAPSTAWPDRGPSPAAKERLKALSGGGGGGAANSSSGSGAAGTSSSAAPAKPAAYVPPSARRAGGSSLAEQMRRERAGELGAAGKVGRGLPGGQKTIPGMAPAAPADSRNKKRKEAAKKRKEAEEAAALLQGGPAAAAVVPAAPGGAPAAAPTPPEPPATKDDLLKRQKALKKKIKQAAELRDKVDAGLAKPTPEQQDKLDRAPALQAELDDLESKLKALL